MRELDWEDTEEIALALLEKFPGQDPLRVRFTDLHRWIVSLPSFRGDPKLSSEGVLEAIQSAWYEEWSEARS